jgi:hypothetical protein
MNTYFETRRYRDAPPQLVLKKHKVHIYLEYHSVCSLGRIGTPHLTLGECVPPPGTKGQDTLVWLGGWGVPIRTTGEKA